MTFRVDMRVDPVLNVLEVTRVSGTFIDQVLPKEIEAARVGPASELSGVGKARQGRVDEMLRPVQVFDRRVAGRLNSECLRAYCGCGADRERENCEVSLELRFHWIPWS